ncbi:MCT family MFS transporter [Aspergillus lucknowensis]|uniref:Major facilitator superfamily domain-containing protein n=1 Tax=Aspergillus lucknowensis TaxID=176173 RepID=A0ABR4LEK9_9EURO
MSADDRTLPASPAHSTEKQPPYDPHADDTIRDGNNSIQSDVQLKDAEKGPSTPPAQVNWGQDAPDGGLEAWLVIVGNWCACFCSFGWINSIGTFEDYYSAELLRGYSESDISWIPSLQIFFMMAMGPVVGKIFDSYGPRWLMIGGSLLHVFGLMMASISTEYYQIMLSQGVCSAIGVASVFQAALACIGGWFNQKRGIAYGIAATGGSVGGVIFPIMVSRLIDEISFEWAMRISAFLILALLVIATATVKTRTPPIPSRATGDQFIQPLTEPAFVAVMIGIFLFTIGFFVPVTYLVVQGISAGMDPDLAGYLVPILNAGSLFGRLLSGFAGDKIGRYNAFIIVCYITGIMVLALWIPASSDQAIIAFAVLFGFFSGAYISLIAALIVQISPLREIGIRTGLVFLLASIGGLTTGPMAGRILDASGWDGVKIFAGVLCLAGTTFVLAARIKLAGPGLTTVF